MSRLIDADELKKRIPITRIDVYQKCWKCTLLCDWEVEYLVNDAPSIDAVPVIRCKDCKHRQEDVIFHKLYCDGREVVADGFCEKGERDEID